jgi:hypothetical protein
VRKTDEQVEAWPSALISQVHIRLKSSADKNHFRFWLVQYNALTKHTIPLIATYKKVFMDLAALYERIVLLVPVEELADGYNAALSEDMSPLQRAVDDVAAAFAKLEEVRDAVHKLEGASGPTTSRSSSLADVLDSTMELQRRLKKKVEATLALMAKVGSYEW